MAAQRRFVAAAAAAVALVCLAMNNAPTAGAVSLKSAIATRNKPAFVDVDVNLATKAELTAQLQEVLVQEMSNTIAEDMVAGGAILSMITSLAKSALKEVMGGMRESMGETCSRLTDIAQSKMDDVDAKLSDEAGNEGDYSHGDYSSGPAEDRDMYSSAPTEVTPRDRDMSPPDYSAPALETDEELSPAYSVPEETPEQYYAPRGYPANAAKEAPQVAMLQVRNKNRALFFKRFLGAVKSGFKKVKSAVGGTLKGVWESTIKPFVIKGFKSAASKVKAQIPGLVGGACKAAEEKLESVESKMVGPTEA